MKQLLFLLVVMVFGFTSCNDDDIPKEENEMGIVQVQAFYTTKDNPNERISDVQSKVFIYYGHYSVDFIDFSYQGDGKLLRGDSIVLPNKSTITNSNGKAILTLEQIDEPFTILIESGYYKKTMTYSYSSSQGEIIFTAIFKP